MRSEGGALVNLGKPGERMDYLTRYLIEEEIEEYQLDHISRREMVRRVLIITGSVPATASILLAAGCGASDDAVDLGKHEEPDEPDDEPPPP